tara:strand:- start:9588 stop:10304 length:717 start_codon:yes stop_codon:yes gene_type:complete
MHRTLVVIGSSSYVLRKFKPTSKYDRIIIGDRVKPEKTEYHYDEFIEYDLNNVDATQSITNAVKGSNDICVLFSSFGRVRMDVRSDIDDILLSMKMNCVQPLNLFGQLTLKYPCESITGVFLSSMYASVAPKPSNYTGTSPINPLYYGVAKAGVEQGIKWLSSQNKKHRFNAIAVGPIPTTSVCENDPRLISKLKESMPSKELVSKRELSKTINWLLDSSMNGLRGATIPLDGGYTIW